MLGPDQVAEQAAELHKGRPAQTTEAWQRQADYLTGSHSSVYVPRSARDEYRWLVERSKVNLLPLVIDSMSQVMFVDGWRGNTSAPDGADPWSIWQANRLDARQTAVHRAMLAHGEAWVGVWPGEPLPVLRPSAPQNVWAYWDDQATDEWPAVALEGRLNGSWWLHEPGYSHTLAVDGTTWRWTGTVETGLAVVPLVRFVNRIDVDGVLTSELDNLLALQDQVNFTTYGLLMAQQFAAFRQRWATGMVTEDEDGNPLPPPNVSVASILTNDSPDGRFGEFAATDLSGYIESREASLRHMAIAAQVPPHHLLGQLVNLSAEALAAAEAGHSRRAGEHRTLAGESWEQALRLAALYVGDDAAATDMSSQVIWRDLESRSLSQVADALGKIAAQLEVPPQALWERLPGVTQADVERWREESQATGLDALLAAALNEQGDAAVS